MFLIELKRLAKRMRQYSAEVEVATIGRRKQREVRRALQLALRLRQGAAAIEEMSNLITVGGLSKQLKATGHEILQAIEHGDMAPPSITYGKRRLWPVAEIPKLRIQLDQYRRRTRLSLAQRMERDGYFTTRRMAMLLHMPVISFQVLCQRGRVPKPTHKYEGWYYRTYRTCDIPAIKQAVKDCGYTANPRLRGSKKGQHAT